MSIESTIEKLVDSKIEKAMSGGTQTVLAEYKGTDSQGKGWVVIAGSTESTPISRATVEASPGDTVSVTVGDGKCVMDANISNPSAGVIGVKKVSKTAQQALEDANLAINYSTQARDAASKARESADAAVGYATDAKAGAENAWEHADEAAVAASTAQTSADDAVTAASAAQTSADAAGDAASTAQDKLAEMEDVVGTVNWIADHAEPTSDETVVEGKAYYSRDEGSGTMQRLDSDEVESAYAHTLDTAPVQGKTYYTLSADSYALTSDTEPDPDKTYYIYDDGAYVVATSFPTTYVLTSDAAVVPGKTYYRAVSEYGYVLTADTAPVAGKQYYTQDGTPIEDIPSTYALTQDSEPQSGKTYYQRVDSYEYVHTQDATPQPGKTYYTYDEETEAYEEVDEPSAEHMSDYYEFVLVGTSYEEVGEPVTADISTYYERTYDMSGCYEYTAVSTSYVEVANPVDADIATYYEAAYDMSAIYELTEAQYEPVQSPVAADMGDYYEKGNPKAQGLYSFSEAIRDFLAAHLFMTERGLSVASSQDGAYRLLAATDGVYIYDASGNLVGKYSETMQVGSLTGTHMEAAGEYLLFLPEGVTTEGYDMDDPDDVAEILSKSVAYIAIDENGNSTFYMTRSVVVEDMYFGDGLWKFYRRSNRNMGLKWMGGE